MITLVPDHYVPEVVTQTDLIIASLAWGFTLGVGWLAAWTATKQTASVIRRRGFTGWYNPYVVMIWGEISVCLAFGIICYLFILDLIPPSFAFFFCILTQWTLQVQFLLQIIINRCGILLTDKRVLFRLKWGVAAIITCINLSVYCIWIPARLQISERYIHLNEIWDRCEKVIYLIVDGFLNVVFIRIVKRNLVDNGLQKYTNLVRFNMFIIGFSLSMDVLIIAMMSMKNTFVYMQFHPLAYIVKLNIEMSMAQLIAKIAKSSQKSKGTHNQSFSTKFLQTRDTTSVALTPVVEEEGENKAWVTTTVETNSTRAPTPSSSSRKLSRASAKESLSCRDGTSYSVHVEASHPPPPARDDFSRRRSNASDETID